MGDAQHKGGVVEGLLSGRVSACGSTFRTCWPSKFGDGDVLFAEQMVFRIVVRQRKRILIANGLVDIVTYSIKIKTAGVVPAVMNQNIMDIHG